MKISPLHEAARQFVANGVPVFPCHPGTKTPATTNGFHDASVDVAQIDAWWSREPEFNVAFSPHMVGLGVVDLDGVAGFEAWEERQIEQGFAPETYEVKTPRGGSHLYYHGILPATQSKLGVHIDTRGVGSYVLAPPSVIDARCGKPADHWGSYSVKNPRPPAELPEWMPVFLANLQKAQAKAATSELDLKQNVARADRLLHDYVKRGHVAKEGEMGDARTYAVACEVMNIGISPDMTMALMEEIWNPACEPPWDPEELWIKVENASRYAQNEAGSWATEPSDVTFARALDKLAADQRSAPRSRFAAWTLEELAALPPLTFLVPEMIPDKGVSLFFGPGGSYKTFLVMGLGLQLAKEGKTVLYLAGEGGVGANQRAQAWRVAHQIEGPLPFHVVRAMPWASDGSMVEEFVEANRALKPDLVIVDTVARMMVGLNENDARDMGLLVAALDMLKEQLDCAVAAIHHTGKDVSRGARGSDALLYSTDAAFEVKADDAVKAAAIWCRRMKDAPIRDRPWTFEGKEIAGSLVFQPISREEHRAMTTADDLMAPKKIGAMLRAMGAVGIENGVSSHVLAQEIVTPSLDTSDEAREVLVSRTVKALAHKARGPLEPYCEGSGPGLLWFVV